MLFNNCKKWDFMPELSLDGQDIELQEELRLLGVVIRSDMKWISNTESIVKKGYDRVWILRRLKKLGATAEELRDVYIKQIRSVLELAVPAWHPSITSSERADIERVQKTALHVILGMDYRAYGAALDLLGLESLEDRRAKLCVKFATKSAKHEKHKNWFKLNTRTTVTRQPQPKYCPVSAST